MLLKGYFGFGKFIESTHLKMSLHDVLWTDFIDYFKTFIFIMRSSRKQRSFCSDVFAIKYSALFFV